MSFHDPDAADAAAFREAMASLAATACVVTATDGAARLGRTVTAAFSLGIAPPSILVSISETSALAAMIRAEGAFSFAMLAEGQEAVADAFAGKRPPEERFKAGHWSRWGSGAPRLEGAVASLDCTVAQEVEIAGHVLFAGNVRDITVEAARRPLVWHARRYNAVQPVAGLTG